MDNVQWTMVVFASQMIKIVAEGDTFIVNCPLSIVNYLFAHFFNNFHSLL